MHSIQRFILTAITSAAALSIAAVHSAARAQPQIPANCIENTSFDGGPDLPGDYRCAGLVVDFHVDGAANSPFPLWAGQWLFADQTGALRLGSCVFNRGIHPTINQPSTPVTQAFPNDPTGSKRAYLTWKYGVTTDNLTAAGLWAVFHYYAQDAAGSNRAVNPTSPLVATLARVSEETGRQDIEDTAVDLDREANQFAAPFAVTVGLDNDGHGVARVLAGDVPVVGLAVTVDADGAAFDDDAQSVTLVTDEMGTVDFEVSGPDHDVTVTASASAPAPAVVYLAAPAEPAGHLPQMLITRGPVTMIHATATATLASTTTTTEEATTTTEAATTTTEAATTTQAPTTTLAATTTTAPATTTTQAATTTTQAATTTTQAATTTTEAATTTNLVSAVPVVPIETPPTAPVSVANTLPTTGSSHGGAAYVGTALLVAGFGVVGAVRRRAAAVGRTDGDGWFDNL